MVSSQFSQNTEVAVVWQKLSCCWTRINQIVVLGSCTVWPMDMLICSTTSRWSLWCATVSLKSHRLLIISSVYKCKWSSARLRSLPNVLNCNSMSAHWCLVSERCTTSKSKLWFPRRHYANSLVPSVRLRVLLRVSWSVRIVNVVPQSTVAGRLRGSYNCWGFALRSIIDLFSLRERSRPMAY